MEKSLNEKLFELNLSFVLAHTIVYEHRVEGVLLFAGDTPAMNVNESMAEVMQAVTANLPALMKVTNAEITPSETAKLQASQAVSPEYLALQDQMFRQYGPSLARTGTDIAAQNAQAQAASDLAVVSGTGRQLVGEALRTAKEGDPEYYKTREGLGSAYELLLKDLNPNELSGGEQEAISRGLAQESFSRGTATAPSQSETVANAMKYGGALNDKKAKISQILSGISSSLPALKSGMDVFQVATGRPASTNTGDNKFVNAKDNLGTSAEGMSSNLLSSGTSLQNTRMQADSSMSSTLDDILKGTKIAGNIVSLGGGFMGA